MFKFLKNLFGIAPTVGVTTVRKPKPYDIPHRENPVMPSVTAEYKPKPKAVKKPAVSRARPTPPVAQKSAYARRATINTPTQSDGGSSFIEGAIVGAVVAELVDSSSSDSCSYDSGSSSGFSGGGGDFGGGGSDSSW